MDPLPAYAKSLIISSALAGMMDHLDQGGQVFQGGLIRYTFGFGHIVVFDLFMSPFSLPMEALGQKSGIMGSNEGVGGILA
jgi:hypothetical protein